MSEERILQAISELDQNLNQRINELDERLNQKIDTVGQELQTKIDNFAEETRKNFKAMDLRYGVVASRMEKSEQKQEELTKSTEIKFKTISNSLKIATEIADNQADKISQVVNV